MNIRLNDNKDQEWGIFLRYFFDEKLKSSLQNLENISEKKIIVLEKVFYVKFASNARGKDRQDLAEMLKEIPETELRLNRDSANEFSVEKIGSVYFTPINNAFRNINSNLPRGQGCGNITDEIWKFLDEEFKKWSNITVSDPQPPEVLIDLDQLVEELREKIKKKLCTTVSTLKTEKLKNLSKLMNFILKFFIKKQTIKEEMK